MNPTETEKHGSSAGSVIVRYYHIAIEHDLHLVMGICERMLCNYGRKLAEGSRPKSAATSGSSMLIWRRHEAFIEEMAQ